MFFLNSFVLMYSTLERGVSEEEFPQSCIFTIWGGNFIFSMSILSEKKI